MVDDRKSNRRQLIAAGTVASLMMLSWGFAYRVLAARLAAPVDTVPISSESLQELPLQIGDWTGKEVPLDEEIVRATDTDAHVNRRYSRRGGLETVSFYVASGVRARDLMPHRPEVCYTGAGWTLTDKRSEELPLSHESKLPCNILQFARGTLNDSKVVVLDYYIVDGQYCSDVSLLRSKAWRGSGTVEYVAQIQIATSVSATQMPHSARQVISDFTIDSAPLIAALFEQAAKDRHPSEDQATVDETHEESKSE